MPKGVISRLYISNIIQLVTVIKKHKKKRSTPNGVKARLYIATGIRSKRARKNRNDPAQKWCCNETHTATLERNANNPRIKRRKLKKPLEIMNAKARRAELSRMIDGANYLAIATYIIQLVTELINERRRKQPYVRTQLPHTGKQHRLQQDVRTQLAIAMKARTNERARKMTDVTSKDDTQLAIASSLKQVGVAAWLECWLSHLWVAGSSPGRDNL